MSGYMNPYYLPVKPPDQPRQQPQFPQRGAPDLLAAPVAGAPKFSFRDLLEQQPGVVAAKYFEKQGLADLASMPGPRGPDMSGYQSQVNQAMADKAALLPRLDFQLKFGKEGLEHQAVIDKRSILNALASRNMLRSGEKPYLQGEQQWAYGRAVTDLEMRDKWSREDLDRQIAHANAAAAAGRASANAAYQDSLAAHARGVMIDKRELRNKVVEAYLEGYNYIIEHPEMFMGAAPDFDPRNFL